VIRLPIWEPYDAFLKISSVVDRKTSATPTGLVSGKKKSIFQKISTWLRGNLFIPDPRIFWVRPATAFLQQYLERNEINTIITTGPPHSMHLIGYRLKRKNPKLTWIADFRDPWSEWGFLDSLMVGGFARNAHRRLEGKVLKTADKVITITPFYVRQFEALSGRKVTLLTNGYDESDFSAIRIVPTKKFIIRHVGTVNEKCDPRPFMMAVEELAASNNIFKDNVEVNFVGEVHPQFKAFIQDSQQRTQLTTFTPPVAHLDLIHLYGSSNILVLVLTGYKDAEGYMPGKLFEYLATRLPIVATGPEDGDAARLLRHIGRGKMIEGSKTAEIKQILLELFERWQRKEPDMVSVLSDQYSRKSLTGQLTELLK
ncbi:MAG TPA: hypothetical protein VK666_23990, partial [Chryseolinea sp.]|nr:hypothetical protein [Chryseolinea sp.]